MLAVLAALAALPYPAGAQAPGRSIDPAYVRARVEQGLRARMPWPAEAVRFESWQLPPPFLVPESARGLRLRIADGEDFVGVVRVALEFFDPARPELSVARSEASVALAVSRPVWIAAAPLARGATLEASMLRSEPRDMRQIPTGAVSDLDAALGQRLKVHVKDGTPLLTSHFDAPELVRRGDLLEVDAGREGFELRVTARALQPGRLGQVIRVENPSSRQSFAVRVTGRGSAALARPQGGGLP